MKKVYLLVVSMLAMLAKAEDILVVEFNDQTVVHWELSEKPKFNVNGGEIVIVSNNEEVRYDANVVDKIYFSASINDENKLGLSDAVLVTVDDNKVLVEGTSSEVSIVSVNGQLVSSKKPVEGMVEFDKPANGLYVVKIGNKSVKIFVK